MSITSIKNWALSANKNNIMLCHSSNIKLSEPEKSSVLFIGGVHGDEPEGVAIANSLLSWLEKNYDPSKHRPWALIPCINIDGYAEDSRTNSNGVDLNRNYPTKNWTESSEKNRYYSGPHPGSEPEIKSLCELINILKPSLIIHFHSWKPCVVLTGPPNLPEAYYLAESSGYKVLPTIGYDTPGSLSQFGWEENNIPVICVEEIDRAETMKIAMNIKTNNPTNSKKQDLIHPSDIDIEAIWNNWRAGLEKILLKKENINI